MMMKMKRKSSFKMKLLKKNSCSKKNIWMLFQKPKKKII